MVLRGVLVVLAVTLAAGVLRFWTLGRPAEKVFDEVYYATDGCLYAGKPFEECGLDTEAERSWVHPPLGKVLISLGIDGFGNRPLGWRVAGAAAGTATVALIGAMAFLLWRRPVWAGAASLLLATEHLHLVQSRTAMLDIFLAFFVVLGFTLLTWDRVRQERRDRVLHPSVTTPVPTAMTAVAPIPRPAPLGRSGPRWLRVAAGLSFGAAVAVKWSGIYAWAGGLLLAVIWERTRRARAGVRRPFLSALREEWPSLALAFVVAPLALYAATWTRWLSEHSWNVAALWDNHFEIFRYHAELDAFEGGEPVHPYMSRAWKWLLLLRPVAYYYEDAGGGTVAEILGIGNPLLFWGGVLVIPYLALAWRTRRDWRAGLALVPILIQYLPWMLVARPLFLFYMVPVTPFLALGMTYVLRDVATLGVRRRRLLATAAATVVLVGVGIFAFHWPVLVGDPIGKEAWSARIWFSGWV